MIGRSVTRFESIRDAAPDASINCVHWDNQPDIDSFDLVVNTTPGEVGAAFLDYVHEPVGVFFEVIYNPWPTALLDKWKKLGGIYVDGLDLLIHQAVSQVEIFSDQKIDRLAMAQLLRSVGEKALH